VNCHGLKPRQLGYSFALSSVQLPHRDPWRFQGGNPVMAPPSKLSMEFGPPRGRKNNDSIVKLGKCNDFGPPLSMSATDLAPRKKNDRLKHEKGRWLKKGHQKFKEIDEIFWGKCRHFFGKCLKRSFGQKIMICRNKSVGFCKNVAPVSEVK